MSKKSYVVRHGVWMLAGKSETSHRMRLLKIGDHLEGVEIQDWILIQSINGFPRVGYIKKEDVDER